MRMVLYIFTHEEICLSHGRKREGSSLPLFVKKDRVLPPPGREGEKGPQIP